MVGHSHAAARNCVSGLLAALLLGACGAVTAPVPNDPLGGHYVASGGGGALAQVVALTKAFAQQHPAVKWTINNVGSDATVPLLGAKQIDLGFVSRELTAMERLSVGFVPLGVTGTGLAVQRNNPVSGLTLDQVRAIYTGAITDWAAVGGTAAPITVVIRDPKSPTRLNFEEVLFGGTEPQYVKDIVVAATGNEMADDISGLANAIGLVTVKDVRLLDPRIKLLALDGVAATKEHVDDGSFPLHRPLFLVFPKDPAQVKPAVTAFVEFVRSPAGQALLAGF